MASSDVPGLTEDTAPLLTDWIYKTNAAGTTEHKVAIGSLFPGASWTPALSFATPGDVSVAYTTQLGRYRQIGKLVAASFSVVTSSFTHSTAAGALLLTSLPVTALNLSDYLGFGVVQWGGISKSGYSQVVPHVAANESQIRFRASGDAVAASAVTAANCPTGGAMFLQGLVFYEAA